MKTNRLYQLVTVLIILSGILALIPAGITRAESNLQTIPTRGPTSTPTVVNTTSAPNTPLPGPSATSQPRATQAAPTATFAATSALVTATSAAATTVSTEVATQPFQATSTLQVGATTSTLPASATNAAVTPTTGDTPTTDPALLVTQAAGAGTQSP